MENKVFFMLSPCGGVGQSFVTSALAIAFSVLSDRKVMIIDASCGFSSVDYIFDLDETVTFDSLDFISGECDIGKICYHTAIDNLNVIPSVSNINEGAYSENMGPIIRYLSSFYDYIFVDVKSFSDVKAMKKNVKQAKAILTVSPQPVFLRNCPQIADGLFDMDFDDISFIINKFDKKLFFSNDTFSNLDEVIDYCKLRLRGIIPYDDSLYRSFFCNFNLGTFVKSLVASNTKSSTSLFSAVKRIVYRAEGQENMIVKL